MGVYVIKTLEKKHGRIWGTMKSDKGELFDFDITQNMDLAKGHKVKVRRWNSAKTKAIILAKA